MTVERALLFHFSLVVIPTSLSVTCFLGYLFQIKSSMLFFNMNNLNFFEQVTRAKRNKKVLINLINSANIKTTENPLYS